MCVYGVSTVFCAEFLCCGGRLGFSNRQAAIQYSLGDVLCCVSERGPHVVSLSQFSSWLNCGFSSLTDYLTVSTSRLFSEYDLELADLKKIGKRQIVTRCQEENKPNRELLKVSTATRFCLILYSEFCFSSELSF